MNIFNDCFEDIDDVVREFQMDPKELEGVEIIYAEYVPGDYCGDAWVLFRKDEKLYEVVGSHCSCSGLEGQWEPSLTSVKAILMRPRLADNVKQLVESLGL